MGKAGAVDGGEEPILKNSNGEEQSVFTKDNSKILAKTDEAYISSIAGACVALVFSAPNGTIASGTAQWAADNLKAIESGIGGVLVVGEGQDFCAGTDDGEIRDLAAKKEWAKLEEISGRFQSLTSLLANFGKPVLAAISGKTLDYGMELALSCRNVLCSEDLLIGFQTGKNGYSPMGGGLARLAESVYAIGDGVAGHDIVPFLRRAFVLSYSGMISSNAQDAKEKGLLAKWVTVLPRGSLPERSIRLLEAMAGPLPAIASIEPKPITVSGFSGKAALDAMAANARHGGFLPEKGLKVASWISWVMCGGDVPKKTEIPPARLLELERTAFVNTCKLLNE